MLVFFFSLEITTLRQKKEEGRVERERKRTEKAKLVQAAAAVREEKLRREAPIIEACKGAGITVKEGRYPTLLNMRELIKVQQLGVRSNLARGDTVSALLLTLGGAPVSPVPHVADVPALAAALPAPIDAAPLAPLPVLDVVAPDPVLAVAAPAVPLPARDVAALAPVLMVPVAPAAVVAPRPDGARRSSRHRVRVDYVDSAAEAAFRASEAWAAEHNKL